MDWAQAGPDVQAVARIIHGKQVTCTQLTDYDVGSRTIQTTCDSVVDNQ